MPGKRFCYYIPPCSFVPGRGMRVSIVREGEGEGGHCPTGDWPARAGGKEPWFWGDKDNAAKSIAEAEDVCRFANGRLGLSDHDVVEIVASSMRR